jgi:hypothetical protein
MAKQKKSGPIEAAVKKAGGGVQSVETSGSDFGARELFGATSSPASVKAMVGKAGEFSRYKHDNS